MNVIEFLRKWCRPLDENAIDEFEKDLFKLENNEDD